jgi:serine/threonine protein kinase
LARDERKPNGNSTRNRNDHPVTPEFPIIPGYAILAELGRSSLAEFLYKARDLPLNRLVLLKLLGADRKASPHQLAIFHKEARTLARLSHPNILALYDVGEANGCPFMTMEYVEGDTLAQRLARAPQYPRPTARLLRTLALAVHYVHERGFIHRDLKPANIRLAPDPEGRSEFGIPKLSDFELALDVHDERPSGEVEGAIVGTPAYMAPEQVLGRRRDLGPATDVYGLGVILYEMLTGKRPFRGNSVIELVQQTIATEPEPVRALQPQAPAALEAICLKCLQKEPAARYPTAAALAEALDRFLAG